jgi:hypothetical protein
MHNIVILLPIKLLFILETRMSFAARPHLLADRGRMPRHGRERGQQPGVAHAPCVIAHSVRMHYSSAHMFDDFISGTRKGGSHPKRTPCSSMGEYENRVRRCWACWYDEDRGAREPTALWAGRCGEISLAERG